MSFDEGLAERFRNALAQTEGVSERRMMGGLCLFVNGNMLGAISRGKDRTDRFMFRVGKENEAAALSRPGASVVEMGGRRMGGFVFVDAPSCKGKALDAWIGLALTYVGALPPK
jgi:TfoX/Sxy family transcriptional regulator of competence genes